MKKLMALVLVLVLAMGACFSVATAETETVDVKLYRAIFANSPQGTPCEIEWQKMVEDYLGVKLNITWEELPFGEFNTKMSVYMAAGDYADAFQISSYSNDQVLELGKQGMLFNLTPHLGEDSYYMQYVNANISNKSMAYASDGNIYNFLDAAKSTIDEGCQSMWTVRFDTFEENNMAIPGSLEEIRTAAEQLKQIYPDSYPVYIGYGSIGRWFNLYESSTGLMFDGEKYVYAPYRHADAHKEIVGYLADLQADGLLDPEWQSDNNDQYFTKLLTGKTFISSFLYGSVFAERINLNTEYDVNWGMIAEPKKLDGSNGYRSTEHDLGMFLNTSYSIAVNPNSPHAELLTKMIDYQYSDEIVNLTNWGIEGVTFNYDENGQPVYTEEIMSAEQPPVKLAEYGVNQSMSCRSGLIFIPQLNDAGAYLQKPNPYYYNGEFGTMTHWLFSTMTRRDLDNVLPRNPARTTFDDLELEDISINKTALDTYVTEELYKFINGTRSMDEWDTYIAEMPNYGNIDLVEQIYNDHIVVE